MPEYTVLAVITAALSYRDSLHFSVINRNKCSPNNESYTLRQPVRFNRKTNDMDFSLLIS